MIAMATNPPEISAHACVPGPAVNEMVCATRDRAKRPRCEVVVATQKRVGARGRITTRAYRITTCPDGLRVSATGRTTLGVGRC